MYEPGSYKFDFDHCYLNDNVRYTWTERKPNTDYKNVSVTYINGVFKWLKLCLQWLKLKFV